MLAHMMKAMKTLESLQTLLVPGFWWFGGVLLLHFRQSATLWNNQFTPQSFSMCMLCVGWNPSPSLWGCQPAGLLQRLYTKRNTLIISPTISRCILCPGWNPSSSMCILCVGWSPSPPVCRGRPAGLLQRLHIIRIYFDYLTDIF